MYNKHLYIIRLQYWPRSAVLISQYPGSTWNEGQPLAKKFFWASKKLVTGPNGIINGGPNILWHLFYEEKTSYINI